MDKLTAIKLKNDDGTFSDKIPIGAEAENVTLSTGKTVEESINEINTTLETVHSTWEDIE